MNQHQPHLTDNYGQLLQRLRKDLQLDATTDLLPGSIAAAVSNDTTTTRLTWTVPTLINAWVNQGGAGVAVAGYLKDPLGFVHLKGRIKTGASGTTAFVLPAGFRPGAQDFYPVTRGGVVADAAAIDAAGNVQIFTLGGGIGADESLGGISFLAEN